MPDPDRTFGESSGIVEPSSGVQSSAASEPGPCDLGKICREAVSATRTLWDRSATTGAKHIRIRTYLRNVRPVTGVQDEIKGILTAMIASSVEAMPDGGDIYLTVEEHDGRANVYAQGSGNGVPDPVGDRVLDPVLITEDPFGKCPGLTAASETVKRYGGEMEVLQRKGGGTTFIVRFPLVPDEKPVKSPSRNKLRTLNVLLVGVDGLVNNLLFRFITGKGAHVSQAFCAAEGIRLFRKNDFDLVIVEAVIEKAVRRILFSSIRKELPDTAIVVVGSDCDSDKSDPPDLRPDALIGFPIYMDNLHSLLCDAVQARRTTR